MLLLLINADSATVVAVRFIINDELAAIETTMIITIDLSEDFTLNLKLSNIMVIRNITENKANAVPRVSLNRIEFKEHANATSIHFCIRLSGFKNKMTKLAMPILADTVLYGIGLIPHPRPTSR